VKPMAHALGESKERWRDNVVVSTFSCCLPLPASPANSITVIIFTAAALAFSIVAVQSCDFVEFSSDTLGSGEAGLFHYMDESGNCVKYRDDIPLSQTDTAARSCGALAAIFGLVALVLVVFEFLFCKLCCARCLESTIYAAAYVSQGCTFLVKNNRTLW